MPILIGKAVDENTLKMTQARKLDAMKPWATDINLQTNEIVWDAAVMATLKQAIIDVFADNDAIVTGLGGDIKKAIMQGFIPVEVYADGFPNYHDVRKLLIIHGSTAQIRNNGGRVPKRAFQQAFTELYAAGKFKTVQPKRTVS